MGSSLIKPDSNERSHVSKWEFKPQSAPKFGLLHAQQMDRPASQPGFNIQAHKIVLTDNITFVHYHIFKRQREKGHQSKRAQTINNVEWGVTV